MPRNAGSYCLRWHQFWDKTCLSRGLHLQFCYTCNFSNKLYCGTTQRVSLKSLLTLALSLILFTATLRAVASNQLYFYSETLVLPIWIYHLLILLHKCHVELLGTFPTKSCTDVPVSFTMSIWLYVTWELLNGFWWKLILGRCTKICQSNPVLVKIRLQ